MPSYYSRDEHNPRYSNKRSSSFRVLDVFRKYLNRTRTVCIVTSYNKNVLSSRRMRDVSAFFESFKKKRAKMIEYNTTRTINRENVEIRGKIYAPTFRRERPREVNFSSNLTRRNVNIYANLLWNTRSYIYIYIAKYS